MVVDSARIVKKLDDAQRQVATADPNQPMLVVAGPGSGKTTTMTSRVALFITSGIRPSQILVMTFTNAGAEEFRTRVGKIVGAEASKEMTVSTYHSFALKLCREHASSLGGGVTADFHIFTERAQRRIVLDTMEKWENRESQRESQAAVAVEGQSIKKSAPRWEKEREAADWLSFLSRHRAEAPTGTTPTDPKDKFFVEQYQAALLACNAVDFGCFVEQASKLLRDQAVAAVVHERYRYLIVDEFQDTCMSQLEFLKLLSPEGRLTCVGDDDQSIFSFGGATPEIFNHLRGMYRGLREVQLTKNYRSTGKLVKATAALVGHNTNRTDKVPCTTNPPGEAVRVWQCRDEASQASIHSPPHYYHIWTYNPRFCSLIRCRHPGQASGRRSRCPNRPHPRKRPTAAGKGLCHCPTRAQHQGDVPGRGRRGGSGCRRRHAQPVRDG